MYYNKINKSPLEYLKEWNLEFKHSGKELALKCIFSDCDIFKQHSRHLYMNEVSGLYHCFKCGAKGNLITMARHLGKQLYSKPKSAVRGIRSKSLLEVTYGNYN
jgi:hypothetical protein